MVVGETMADPPEYVYVFAPEGTMVNDCPAQMLPLLTDTVGEIRTVTLEIAGAALAQPFELYPVTE